MASDGGNGDDNQSLSANSQASVTSSTRSITSRISNTAAAAVGRSKRVIVKTAKAAALRIEDLTSKRVTKKHKGADAPAPSKRPKLKTKSKGALSKVETIVKDKASNVTGSGTAEPSRPTLGAGSSSGHAMTPENRHQGSTIELSSDDDDPSENRARRDQDELAKARAKWKSPIYGFFKSEVEICYDTNKRPYHLFKCTNPRCKLPAGVRRYLDTNDKASTSNLKTHAVSCWGRAAVDAATTNAKEAGRDKSIWDMLGKGRKDPHRPSMRSHTNVEIRAHCAQWIAENNRPVRIVEDEHLQHLLLAGRPGAEIPSRTTVTRDLKTCYHTSKEKLIEFLAATDARVSIATDTWTSPNHRAFSCYTGTIAHEGKPLLFLLDIVELPESHTGTALAAALQQVIEDFDLADKVLSLIGDNASPNDKMTELVGQNPANSFREDDRVRCFNHTLQLAANALLYPFGTFRKKKHVATAAASATSGTRRDDRDDPDLTEDDDLDDLPPLERADDDEDDEGEDFSHLGFSAPADITPEEYAALLDALDNVAREVLSGDSKDMPPRTMLTKLRRLAKAIVNSPTKLLPVWRDACGAHHLSVRMLPRDVKTRWNSTYDMLILAIRYRVVIDDLTGRRDLGLRALELTKMEWDMAMDLSRVLKVFKQATLFFSRDDCSTITSVIPTMDKIDELMASSDPDTKRPLHATVKAAMRLAKAKVNQYYGKTDLSRIYRIAMILHPGLKLEYFKAHDWEDEWISVAKDLLVEEYQVYAIRHKENSPTASDIKPVDIRGHLDDFDMFQNISVTSQVREQNDLDRYLAAPLEHVTDPLMWWWDNRKVYPVLSLMAMDFLAVPATSTSVERVFSQGRHLLPFTRNRLATATTRMLMCFGAWSRHNLVRTNELVAAISRTCKKRARETIELSSDSGDN